jgi:hypothetical protein
VSINEDFGELDTVLCFLRLFSFSRVVS